MIRYQARLYRDGAGYSVEFPDLPGCFSNASNKEIALANAREALSLYLEDARDPDWSVPPARVRRTKWLHWISPEPNVAIPLMIRQARQKASLSQRELSRRLGMTVQLLQKLETPGKSNPTVKTLHAISEALNQSLFIDLVA